MSTDCTGRHRCDPPEKPRDITDMWCCWACGVYWYAYRPWDDPHTLVSVLGRITPQTLGWTTRKTIRT